MSSENYVLLRGDQGAQRLERLGAATWPTTRRFFHRLGVAPGWRCLDVGCGVGTVTRRLAARTGHCLGVDIDPGFLRLAQERSDKASFQARSIYELDSLEERFDLVYARYLLSHLSDPLTALQSMARVTRPGGIVAVEDIHFGRHFWHPECPALDRYVDLYERLVSQRGGNPRLGPELLHLAQQAGLREVSVEMVVPVYHRGPGKRIAEVTLAHIGESARKAGLVEAQEFRTMLRQIRQFRKLEHSQISIAPTFQVSGIVVS